MDPVKESGLREGRRRKAEWVNHRQARRARILGIAVASLTLSGLALWAVTEISGGPALVISGVAVEGVSGLIVMLAYTLAILGVTAIGVAIASRVPTNPIGWILLGVGSWGGLSLFIGSLLIGLASLNPGGTDLANLSRWLGRWTFVPVITVPITFVLMLVPDGRLLSARWRVLPWLAGIGITGWAAAEAFSQLTPLVPNPYPNPTVSAVAGFALLALAPAFVGSGVSVVVRFRRADQHARQQIKWVAFGGALEVTVTILLWILSEIRPSAFGATAVAVGTVSGLITPTANGVAILKYRLYDIDRLINRTVTYGLVVGVLAAVYASLAIGLPQLLQVPGDSPAIVAIATLVSFAVFRPATRWVQAAIDRRFNRARYDAQLEVDTFSTQLTHRVAMDQVIAATTSLLERTLQPDELGIWIRDPGRPVNLKAISGGNRRL